MYVFMLLIVQLTRVLLGRARRMRKVATVLVAAAVVVHRLEEYVRYLTFN